MNMIRSMSVLGSKIMAFLAKLESGRLTTLGKTFSASVAEIPET